MTVQQVSIQVQGLLLAVFAQLDSIQVLSQRRVELVQQELILFKNLDHVQAAQPVLIHHLQEHQISRPA